MRVCDFQTSLSQLKEASQKLSEQWSAAGEVWNDSKSKAFEEDHLKPIEPILSWTVAAVNHMQEIMQQVEQDLE